MNCTKFCNEKSRHCKFLQYQHVDTTKFCKEKADITNFTMKNGETMNFCSAKKRTLQSFLMKKADNANSCSPKRQTLQSLKETLQNCVVDTTKLYSGLYTTNLGMSVIMCACIQTLIQRSHMSQTVTQLLSSHHNHHLNHTKCTL